MKPALNEEKEMANLKVRLEESEKRENALQDKIESIQKKIDDLAEINTKAKHRIEFLLEQNIDYCVEIETLKAKLGSSA